MFSKPTKQQPRSFRRWQDIPRQQERQRGRGFTERVALRKSPRSWPAASLSAVTAQVDTEHRTAALMFQHDQPFMVAVLSAFRCGFSKTNS